MSTHEELSPISTSSSLRTTSVRAVARGMCYCCSLYEIASSLIHDIYLCVVDTVVVMEAPARRQPQPVASNPSTATYAQHTYSSLRKTSAGPVVATHNVRVDGTGAAVSASAGLGRGSPERVRSTSAARAHQH